MNDNREKICYQPTRYPRQWSQPLCRNFCQHRSYRHCYFRFRRLHHCPWCTFPIIRDNPRHWANFEWEHKEHVWIRKQSTPPLPLNHLTLITLMLLPKIMDPLTPITHIRWEISNLPPTPTTQGKIRKISKIILMIKLKLTPPLWPQSTQFWHPQ